MASTLAVAHETKSTFVRTTKDGRQIRYSLQVIQQPERARACGSGAKSSADRRPVDPPPIVELRVFENEVENTMAYNANFFLHASLENARHMAAGRAPATAPSFPVLTGTPVAGMAYLDRPTPAGYFIFPDLSVRHEGKYRLSFSLFENLSEAKDLDPEDPDVIYDGNHFVTHRAEVKSMPFTVFSAKKFPGLSESTALSRMVAEQGCRVRIRRDVRMRRRENKSSKDWDEFDEEADGYQQRRTATPDVYGDRPRSVSNASATSLSAPRRPSMDDIGQAYSAPGYQEMPPPPSSYNPMPPYAPDQHYQPQYSAPPPAPVMQPPHAPYAPQPPYHSPPHANQQYAYPPNYPPNHYEHRPEHPEYSHSSHSSHSGGSVHSADFHRRPSVSAPAPYPPASYPTEYRAPVAQTSPPVSASHASPPHLPHLKTLHPHAGEKPEPPSPVYQSPPAACSSSNMSVYSDSSQHSYPPPTFTSSGAVIPPVQASAGTKRSFAQSFDTRHVEARLVGGQRPNPGGAGYAYEECGEDEERLDRAAMMYRRADGTQRQRCVPEVGR